jgi:diaminopimelate epimerase
MPGQIPFYKYQGAGNDFILIDNRQSSHLQSPDNELIATICDRRLGVGADGLILLQNKEGFDFEMMYFNSDGKEGSMCGNGGRCIVAFAKILGIIGKECNFIAVDGPHQARAISEDWIELKMSDVYCVEREEEAYILNTGSPHYVIFVEDIDDINVVESGQIIRYSDRFSKEGINVNFVERKQSCLFVATYERGVENETLSCGTGVTASAISLFYKNKLPLVNQEIEIMTKGGGLKVRYTPTRDGNFQDIWLCGPAQQVFKGEFMR